MKNALAVCVCFFAAVAIQTEAKKILPGFITACKRHDSNLSNCWKTVAENLRPHLVQGIPQLKLAPIDPLVIKAINMFGTNTTVGSYNVTAHNVEYTGTKDYEIVASNIDLDKLDVMLKLRFEQLNMSCDVTGSGVILDFEIGKGIAYIRMWNVSVDVVAKGTAYVQKEKTYVKWQETSSDVSLDKTVISPKNFLDNPSIDGTFTNVVEENSDLFHPQLMQLLQKSFGAYIVETLNRIHKIYPLDVLYPKY